MDSRPLDGSNLCFIVGSPRSGTTWLQRLIASHPRIHTGQESHVFAWYVGPQLHAWKRELKIVDDPRGGLGMKCYLRDEEFRGILKDYALNLMKPMLSDCKEGEIFVDKTPRHAFNIPEIMEVFPESRVINVLRDPRDAVASMIAASRSWSKEWTGNLTARRAARECVSFINAVENSKKIIPSGHFLQVRYEELLASTPERLGEAWRFLALDYDQELLDDAVEKNTAKATGTTGTKIPLGGEASKGGRTYVTEPAGFIRRAKEGTWKKDLSPVQKFEVWAVARRTMEKVGYEWKRPW